MEGQSRAQHPITAGLDCCNCQVFHTQQDEERTIQETVWDKLSGLGEKPKPWLAARPCSLLLPALKTDAY